MRSRDGKLEELRTALPGFSRLPCREQQRFAQEVELVDVRAGGIAARAGFVGRWQTLVVSGAVATTEPALHYRAGDLIVHGPATAIVALTDARLATADVRAAAFGRWPRSKGSQSTNPAEPLPREGSRLVDR